MQKIAGVACKLHTYLCLFEHDFPTTPLCQTAAQTLAQAGSEIVDVSGNSLNGTLNAIEP